MSCFCIANLDLLPRLSADPLAALTLSASAQAALALSAQISLGIPDLPLPPGLPSLPSLPELNLSLDVVAAITALAQLQSQLTASLGLDLTTAAGLTGMARIAATLDARLSAIAELNLNLTPWMQLQAVNAAALNLTAVFNACLTQSASLAFNVVLPSPAWGGMTLPVITALLASAAAGGAPQPVGRAAGAP